MPFKKIDSIILVFVLGILCTAGAKLIQTDYRVDSHDESIKTINVKIDQISSDTQFIRGKLEGNK